MKEESKQCFRCKFFERYYIKGIKRFDATKIGQCRKSETLVQATNGCEKCTAKPTRRRLNRALRMHLNDILIELTEIRAMLESEQDDEKL